MIAFACPRCGRQLQMTDEYAGKTGTCSGCNERVPVPSADPSVEVEAESETIPVTIVVPIGSSAPTIPPAEVTAAGANPLAFLAPPQQSDELGRLGGYRVLKVLGTGGMGMVLLAEDPALRRSVALKVMRPELAGSSSRQRFLREAQAAAGVEHVNIVAIHQVGEDRGVPFIAMAFLKGESLETRLARDRTVPPAESVRVARQVAEGLAAAHDGGLIHRDIKPANIWLERPSGLVKILDFGLARVSDADVRLTHSGMIVGTPAYMAPEQASGSPLDARTDLFSLGCVLYQMCTGERPFKGRDTISTLLSITSDVPRAVRELNPSVPQPVADFVTRLLAKNPAERPQSARAAADELAAIEAGSASKRPAHTGRGRALAAVLMALGLLVPAGYFFGRPLLNGHATGSTDTEPKTPATSETAPSADRTATKWVQSVGGTAAIHVPSRQSSVSVRKTTPLPDEPFELVEVDLSKCDGVTDAGLEAIRDLQSLAELNLNGTSVGSGGLKFIPTGGSLTVLNLDGTRVTDDGLARLERMTSLLHLDLAGTPITDAGLAHLKQLRHLKTLSLANTSIGDPGLDSLHGLVRLEKLDLRRTKVTPKGALLMKRAVPKCLLDTTDLVPHPTKR
jgi:serine/threonine protein kinase